jgi:hypothetical protein
VGQIYKQNKGRQRRDSSDDESDSEDDNSEASFQRWWQSRRPEPPLRDEPIPNPPAPRRRVPSINFNNIEEWLLVEDIEAYLGPP